MMKEDCAVLRCAFLCSALLCSLCSALLSLNLNLTPISRRISNTDKPQYWPGRGRVEGKMRRAHNGGTGMKRVVQVRI